VVINSSGEIIPGLYALATAEVPVFLLDGDRPVLFDAGFACLADFYTDHLEQILGDREPVCCCLTHSHFDHIGSVSWFKDRYPGLAVCAHPRVGDIMQRPGAVERIAGLNEAARDTVTEYGLDITGIKKSFFPFALDQFLNEGDRIEVSPDLSVQVVETPGHTRDCLSYYIPEKKALIASEALGIPDYTGYVVTDFLVGYDTYMASMKRLDSFDIDVLCFGHSYVYTGADARGFIPRAMQHAEDFFSLVATCLEEEEGDVERVVERVRAIEYDPKTGPKQPEPAYLMNLQARIAAVQKRLQEGPDN